MSKHNDEINIAEFIIPLWKGKILILITAIVFALLAAIYLSTQEQPKKQNIVKTTIKPISTFEEIEYQHYNNYIKEFPFNYNYPIQLTEEALLLNNLKVQKNRDFPLFNEINKEFLLQLFIEKIHETKFLKNELKKSKLVKIDEFKNIYEYEKKIIDLLSTIKFKKSTINKENDYTNWVIEFKTSNITEWKNFFLNLENNTNLEIKKYLKTNFENQILDNTNFNKFKIEDIEILLLSNNMIDGEYKNYLLALKEKLKSTRDIIRLNQMFNGTPILSENFNAARIVFTENNIVQDNWKRNERSFIFVSALFGTVLSILYILFFKPKRSKNKNKK